jgi:ABC-type anion transport system duplicated permease subunit
MWISAALLVALAAFAIYGYSALHPVPLWQIATAIVVGLAAGVPVGILRGYHTQVSATERPGVMQLGASWPTAAIYLGAFALRAAMRFFFPVMSPAGSIVGDALLVFAIGIVGASYFAIFRKYERLRTSSP